MDSSESDGQSSDESEARVRVVRRKRAWDGGDGDGEEEDRRASVGLGFQGIAFVGRDGQGHDGNSSSSNRHTAPSALGQRKEHDKIARASKSTSRSFLPRRHHAASTVGGTLGSRPLGAWSGSGYGLKMLQKFGFDPKAGHGLGLEGQGRTAPIETKLRPSKAGLAYGGFKERVEGGKGDQEDDVDEERPFDDKPVEPFLAGWKRTTGKKTASRSRHPTADEVIASMQRRQTAPSKLVDMTGTGPRHVASLDDVAVGTDVRTILQPDDDGPMPELRYNVRVIVNAARKELETTVRLGRAREEQRAHLMEEARWLKTLIEQGVEAIKEEELCGQELTALLARSSEVCEGDARSSSFLDDLVRFLGQHAEYVEAYDIRDLFFAEMKPHFKTSLAKWNPLTDPTYLLQTFKQLKATLDVTTATDALIHAVSDPFHRADLEAEQEPSRVMTAYEDLVYTQWLPRIRSAINNDWDVYQPDVVVGLLHEWSPALAPFIREEIIDQLVLPKLLVAIKAWRPELGSTSESDPALAWLLPWFSVGGRQMAKLVDEVQRKFKSRLIAWRPGQPTFDLSLWIQVRELDLTDVLLKTILPKLAKVLDALEINPARQDLGPLDIVMPWAVSFRPKVFQQLFETHFFDRWLHVLHDWLCDDPDYDQIAQWYAWWKSTLLKRVPSASWNRSFDAGFAKGLELMNLSSDLGPDGTKSLPVPSMDRKKKTIAPSTVAPKAMPSTLAPTFREIVEHHLNQVGLFMHKSDQVDLPTGRPIFLVNTKAKSGGGGGGGGVGGLRIRLSPQDEVIWRESVGGAASRKGWTPTSLEELIRSFQR